MNKEKYLLALAKAIKYLQKCSKMATTRTSVIEIKEIRETLNSLYYEIKQR